MCGIVGYIGQEVALPFLLDGLSRLEYRGYDSAGVATLSEGSLSLVKAKGRLSVLKDRLTEHPLSGTVGIGHTRWATHGAPSDANAHPHLSPSGRFAVVHNGIIENDADLRRELTASGAVFASETDTEVIAWLLDRYADPDPQVAVRKTVSRLSGSFALGILDRHNPDRVIAVRQDSPLVVGAGENGFYLASDIPALLPYTRKVYLMEDGELAILSRTSAQFLNADGCPVDKPQTMVDWDTDAAEMGGYAHFMEKEMHEEPDVLKRTLHNGEFCIDKRPSAVHIVACGSAYHAGVVGKYVIEKLARIPVFTDIASEYRYRSPILDENTLVVVISQSGETADTLAALREAKRLGAKVLGIVNVLGSTIAREADSVFYTSAGPEIAVATTKAYSAQLMAIYRLALALADRREDLSDLPRKVSASLQKAEEIETLAKTFAHAKSIFYIGRGCDYALAMEGSLKLKEISYIHSEAYGAGELKHGTISLIEEGSLVVALCTQNELLPKMVANIREVKSRGAKVLAVTQEGCDLSEVADWVWTIPPTPDAFAALPAVTLLQLFAYYVAKEKGCDIDKPRNLAKSVTVE